MCLCGTQLISPDYVPESQWKMDLSAWRQPSLSHLLTEVGGRGGAQSGLPQPGLTYRFCMSVSFHNSSAKHDCQASFRFWRSIRSCQPAVTTERWVSHFHIPAGQLASTLFQTLRDNETISANQEHLPFPPSHSHWLPLRYARVLKSPWLILLFFSVLSHFVCQMKHFLFCSVKGGVAKMRTESC